MMYSKNPKLRLLHKAGVDFHVLATLLSRGWSVIAGALTLLMLPAGLTTVEQGYYYTFASLLGMQILFEAGLGQVIIQIVGHEAANLRYVEGGTLDGDDRQLDRIASLTQFLRRWYRIAALVFCLLAGGGGGLFLAVKGVLPLADWLPVWVVMVLVSGLNLTYVPALAIQEGLGRIGEVAHLRMKQSAVGYLCMWIALAAHLSLWASCFVPLASALLTSHWLGHEGRIYKWLSRRLVATDRGIDWRQDVMPLQWRIAISAISGYFIFYAFTPLVFANRGAVEAGRFGIAMAVFNALAAVGTSWVYAKTPVFGMHIARGERSELNTLFRAVLLRSVLFTTILAAIVVFAVAGLDALGVPQMKRIADPAVLSCLALVCGANSIIFSVAAYMRAHREEPMLIVSLCGGISTMLIAYFGSRYGVLAMSMLYAGLTTCVLLPWSLALFFRYYRRR